MIRCIASIAEKEDIFLVGRPTDGARGALLVLQVVLNPSIRVEFCDLFFVFDCVFGNNGA